MAGTATSKQRVTKKGEDALSGRHKSPPQITSLKFKQAIESPSKGGANGSTLNKSASNSAFNTFQRVRNRLIICQKKAVKRRGVRSNERSEASSTVGITKEQNSSMSLPAWRVPDDLFEGIDQNLKGSAWNDYIQRKERLVMLAEKFDFAVFQNIRRDPDGFSTF